MRLVRNPEQVTLAFVVMLGFSVPWAIMVAYVVIRAWLGY